jgi:hypothetical protein
LPPFNALVLRFAIVGAGHRKLVRGLANWRIPAVSLWIRLDLVSLTAFKAKARPPVIMHDDSYSAHDGKEIRSLKQAQSGIVSVYNRLWHGTTGAEPTKMDLAQATEMIDCDGRARAKEGHSANEIPIERASHCILPRPGL